ncbi:hypothetical protein ABK040_016445 [Willaertia magna]
MKKDEELIALLDDEENIPLTTEEAIRLNNVTSNLHSLRHAAVNPSFIISHSPSNVLFHPYYKDFCPYSLLPLEKDRAFTYSNNQSNMQINTSLNDNNNNSTFTEPEENYRINDRRNSILLTVNSETSFNNSSNNNTNINTHKTANNNEQPNAVLNNKKEEEPNYCIPQLRWLLLFVIDYICCFQLQTLLYPCQFLKNSLKSGVELTTNNNEVMLSNSSKNNRNNNADVEAVGKEKGKGLPSRIIYWCGNIPVQSPLCISIMNVVIWIFIFQGIFGLSSSFILLYNSGDKVLRDVQNYQNLQRQSFIKYEVSKLSKSFSVLVDHADFQFRSGGFNLNNQYQILRLEYYMTNLFSTAMPIKLLFFGRFDNYFLGIENSTVRYFTPSNGIITDYAIANESDIGPSLFLQTPIQAQNISSIFVPIDRPWFAPYKAGLSTSIRWSELFINIESEITITLSIPLYLNETVTDELISRRTLYPCNSIECKKKENLYAVFGCSLRVDEMDKYLSTSFVSYHELDLTFIVNSDAVVIAKSVSSTEKNIPYNDAISDIINELAEVGLLSELNSTKARNETIDVKFNLWVNGRNYLIEFLSITDEHGLDWAIVVCTLQITFAEQVVASGVVSLAIFIIIFVFGMICLFIVIRGITRPITILSKEMLKISKLEDIKLVKHDGSSNFYDIKAMQKSLKSLKNGLKLFSTYVPDVVAKNSVKEESKIGATPQYQTILFCDIEKFHFLIDRIHPNDLMNLLSDYFHIICNAVQNYGVIDKFVEGAVIAFFNESSMPLDDHEFQACRIALEILEGIEELNRKLTNLNYPEINVQIGVNSGEVLCGNFGSESRMSFTVMSDVVSSTAKLLAMNGYFETNILIGENTWNRVNDRLVCYFVDFVKFSASSSASAVYSLEKSRIMANDLDKKLCKDLEKAKEFMKEKDFKRLVNICENICKFSDSKISKHLMNRAKLLKSYLTNHE